MRRSLRVTHVIHSGAVGGGPAVVLGLAKNVPGEHTIVAPDDGPLPADARDAGISVTRLRWGGEYSFAAAVPFLIPELRKADIVHLHGQFAGFYGSLAAAIARRPAIYTAHFPSFVTDAGLASRVRNHVAEATPCTLSARTICCSNAMRDEYIERGLVPPRKVKTIYNGVPSISPDAPSLRVRTQLGMPESGPVIVSVGRFTKQKGFDLLLRAMPYIRKEIPTVQAILVGDGDQRPNLEQLARNLGIEDIVWFTGFRDDVENFFRLASVVAVPSLYDVFPLVPLEAMMAGKAVIASDLPVLREAIRDGETGLLVPRDPKQWAEAICRVISDSRMADELGRKAELDARERFSIERMAKEYLSEYESLTAKAS
jgi:glycosyltransferase involved in cell wall biosynthesis